MTKDFVTNKMLSENDFLFAVHRQFKAESLLHVTKESSTKDMKMRFVVLIMAQLVCPTVYLVSPLCKDPYVSFVSFMNISSSLSLYL